MQAAKHLLWYLNSTIDLEIIYRTITKSIDSSGNLILYADAAYMNICKFKSTTRYLAIISNESVIWISCKQSITVQSTTESEYIALVNAAKQAIWLCHLLYAIWKAEVYGKKMTTIYGDNKDSLDLTVNLVFHSCIKHIQVQYHAIQDYIEREEIRIQYVQTDDMLANSLMKPLDQVKFEWMIKELGLQNW